MFSRGRGIQEMLMIFWSRFEVDMQSHQSRGAHSVKPHVQLNGVLYLAGCSVLRKRRECVVFPLNDRRWEPGNPG